MGRKFEVTLGERLLRVCVSAVDEAWELWVCDGRNRLMLGGTVGIDEATLANRDGCDPVALAGRSLADQLKQGLLKLPIGEPLEPCPHLCELAERRMAAVPLT